MIIRPAVFDRDILALDIAGFGQALTEGGSHRRVRPGRRTVEKPDHRHRRLLRPRRERPSRRRAAEERYELAPVAHSITSSAAASSLSGTARPNIRAVCALMTSSNLFACTTGKSSGFAPLRMRPV